MILSSKKIQSSTVGSSGEVFSFSSSFYAILPIYRSHGEEGEGKPPPST